MIVYVVHFSCKDDFSDEMFEGTYSTKKNADIVAEELTGRNFFPRVRSCPVDVSTFLRIHGKSV